MKYKLLAVGLCILTAGFCIAQTDSVSVSRDTVMPAIDNTIVQRHPTVDAVQQLANLNEENLPFLIEYHNDRETKILATELRDILLQYGLTVRELQLADTTQVVPNARHNNFTYRVTDSLFIITTHARKK